jgi:hypothetical protein
LPKDTFPAAQAPPVFSTTSHNQKPGFLAPQFFGNVKRQLQNGTKNPGTPLLSVLSFL